MSEGIEFGLLADGETVHRFTISAGGLSANILTWGAVIQDLRMDGHREPLVLGFEEFDYYPAHSRYFGATAGRCANRIREARFEIDGAVFEVDRNFLGKHHLHGGSAGIGKRNWRVNKIGSDRIELAINCADGEMGYPGRLEIRQTIALLDDGVLDIVLEARSDAPTLCNLAHHSYFNLDGAETILDHELRLAADHYLPVDDELIPTGEIAAVDSTLFDFRSGKELRAVCKQQKIDHNFCLAHARRELVEVATLRSPSSGIAMDVATTEPGLQVYVGSSLNVPVPGLEGKAMRAHAGIALEPQAWPDAINNSAFPQAVLRPGESYRQHTRYTFRMDEGR